MAEQPNDASRKSKAEGDRGNLDKTAPGALGDDQGGGITNRPLDEEIANQQAVPERGESKPGAHAGHGDADEDDRRSER